MAFATASSVEEWQERVDDILKAKQSILRWLSESMERSEWERLKTASRNLVILKNQLHCCSAGSEILFGCNASSRHSLNAKCATTSQVALALLPKVDTVAL